MELDQVCETFHFLLGHPWTPVDPTCTRAGTFLEEL